MIRIQAPAKAWERALLAIYKAGIADGIFAAESEIAVPVIDETGASLYEAFAQEMARLDAQITTDET